MCNKRINIRDMGEAKEFLNIRIKQRPISITIDLLVVAIMLKCLLSLNIYALMKCPLLTIRLHM